MIARKIALLGSGAMGSRMGARLLDAGQTLTVWNRTPEKTQHLVAAGARTAATPAEAASGADTVIAMVRDDQASREVWL
ncbi:MAG: NAD(P)-binding domain-containing protein, partial [Pseudomonadota bacterium]